MRINNGNGDRVEIATVVLLGAACLLIFFSALSGCLTPDTVPHDMSTKEERNW